MLGRRIDVEVTHYVVTITACMQDHHSPAAANAANACPNGADLVAWPSEAIEAIIAEVVRRFLLGSPVEVGVLAALLIGLFLLQGCSVPDPTRALPHG